MNLLQKHQYQTFGLIWITYCVVYFLRKPLGIVKPELEAVFHLR
jgi:sugar phosphate permease